MTLKELEIFYKLAKYNHMGKTAKELGITQSAVSLAIKSLENSVGEKLFERIGKKVVLNEYGREFYNFTHPSYLKLKEAEFLFKIDKLKGELKIASSKTYGNFIIPKKIVSFLDKHDGVKIRHIIKNSKDILDLVLTGDIDLGIIETEINEPEIEKKIIAGDKLIVVSGDETLKQKEVFIDTVLNKKWILREKGSGTREMFLNSIKEFSKDLNIFMECSEIDEIKNFLLEDKEIITCISEITVQKELKEGKLFKINLRNIEIKRNFYLIYHKNRYKTELFKEFMKFI